MRKEQGLLAVVLLSVASMATGDAPLSVGVKYHGGPVMTNTITVYPIWYGSWERMQKHIIRDFLNSISAVQSEQPSIAGWWKTARLYTDKTGANVSGTVLVGNEISDRFYSHGKSLTRLAVQSVIKRALTVRTHPLPINNKGGVYLVLTSADVSMESLCVVCGFHFHSSASIVGYKLPFAWVGNSAKICPWMCAYPFAVPSYAPGLKPEKSPNGDVGVDGMINIIAHELAELVTDPFMTSWYAGDDPTFPIEIADLCLGIFGTGAGGSYIGDVSKDQNGATYNMNGIRRRFLVQWLWNPVLGRCRGPNTLH